MRSTTCQEGRDPGCLLEPSGVERHELDQLRAAIEQRDVQQFGDLATLVFQSLIVQRSAFHIRHLDWPTTAGPNDVVWPVFCASSNRGLAGEDAWVFDLGGTIVRLFISADRIAKASLAATNALDLDAAEEALCTLLPRETAAPPQDDGSVVPVTFWSNGIPSSTRRRLPTPTWTDIESNYTPSTRALLEPLVENPEQRNAGQLVLWHGEPGTGKTYAIRALAHAWRSWCDIHYITDPEVFFGPTTSYMRDVLMDSDGYYTYAREVGDPELDEPEPDERWRLLVLEDTGELLGIDAKVDTGQGLSRLLNLVDGFLGQGVKLLILLTTNEPLARLHPAVVRPGRCAAVVEFERFAVEEADRWLRDHGSDANAGSTVSLAELYSLVAGHRLPAAPRPVGFV
jgi:hypothetical protein